MIKFSSAVVRALTVGVLIKVDIAKFGKVIKTANIKAEN